MEITSSAGEPGRKLLIVKDSYSHCFAPFAANHFETTTLLDLRYFNMGVRQYMEENGNYGCPRPVQHGKLCG